LQQEHTWISRCLVTQSDPDGIIGHYTIQVACNASDEVELHRRLHDLVAKESFTLISIDYSRLIQDHLDRLDYYDQASVQLAAVAAQHGYALGELQPTESNQKTVNAEGPSYLEIEQHEVTLDIDSKKPSWQQPWINPTLKKLLFTEETRTYLLVDATTRGQLTKTFDLEDFDDLDIRSLYAGQLAQELKHQAPYVVDLTLNSEQIENDESVPKFHRDFFTKHWGKNTGIIVQSEVPIDKMVFHLKKFIKIQDKNNKWFYFRFFDPRTMNHYLQSIQKWPQRVAKWYAANKDSELIQAFFCEDQQGEKVNAYRLRQNHGLKHSGKVTLTKTEFEFFKDYRWSQNKKRIEAELRQDFQQETAELHSADINSWCEEGLKKEYTTPRALYDYCYAKLMAKTHGFDLSQIEQYLSEQTTSHLEKSKLLYESTKDAVKRYATGTKTQG
jgi:hypothetical protein